jgi:hypothetical protein
MIYKFKVAYTKLGIGTAPSSAPVCTVVDSANNKLADAQATTALANLPGVYLYSYTGAAGLDLIALFHTTDASMDQQDLYSYTSHLLTTNLDAPISAVDTVVDTIDGKIDNLDGDVSDVFDDVGDVQTVVDLILTDTGTTLPALINTRSTLGVGAITWIYNLVDEHAVPIADATVWVSSDLAGAVVLASGLTDAAGNVTFYLDAGTVYVWCQKSGYNFTNPDTEVVS